MNPAITYAPARELTEAELVDEFLQIQNEEELDRFLPLLLPALKVAGPLLGKVAGPLLKGVAGSLLGGGSSSPRRGRRTNRELEEEQFLGKILGGLFGEVEAESEEEEQFLGKILGGLLGEAEVEGEEEQYFLGKLLGGLFGGRKNRELEDQFIGGLLGKLFGRELELEDEAEAFGHRAQRFIRLARVASRDAARELSGRLRAGERPSEPLVQQIVLRAFVRTAHRIGGAPGPVMREVAASSPAAGARDNGSWVRRGNRLVITL